MDVKRYCSNCNTEQTFNIMSMEDLNNLVCPSCGAVVDKNSKSPEFKKNEERMYNNLGSAAGGIFSFFYIFYVVCALVGIIGYILKINTLLYVMTGISLVAYILQWMIGTVIFTSGLIFLPIGAIVGFIVFKGVAGACLGMMIVFAVRHVMRDIFFAFIAWLIKIGNKK